MSSMDPIVSFLEGRLNSYLEDLRTLVSIDSGSDFKPGVDAVVAWLADRLAAAGFQVERDVQTEFGDNLLATQQGRGRGRVLLLGHADTVFPTGTAAQRPLHVEGDKILGPGTCDMKAGLLTGLYAVEALRAIGFDGLSRIAYLAVSDEESGGRRSIPLIRSQCRQATAVLGLEAARENGDLVTARKGIRWVTVEAFGRAAHAGVEPEKGASAILALARHVPSLHGLNGFRPGGTVNVGVFEGGSLPSVVPAYARMRIDLRALSLADMEALADAVEAELGRDPVPGVRLAVSLEEGSDLPPMEHTPGGAKLEKLAQLAARELGFEVRGAATGGAADASWATVEGIPALDGLGPVGGLDHSPDEYILRSSIVPRTALLVRLMIAIANMGKEQAYGDTGPAGPSAD